MQGTHWMAMGLVTLVGCGGEATRSDNEGTGGESTTHTITGTTRPLSIGGLVASTTNATTTNGTATGSGGTAMGAGGTAMGAGGTATSSTASAGGSAATTTTLNSGSGGAGGTTTTGSAGAAGAEPMGDTYTFDEGLESWEPQYLSDGVNGTELGWTDGALLASLEFSDITARPRFAGFGVSVDALDLSSATITADVRQLSAGDSAENSAQLYVRTGSSVIAFGPLTSLPVIDTWFSLSFTLAEPQTVLEEEGDSYDPRDVREIGVEFRGSVTALSTVMFSIDNVSY